MVPILSILIYHLYIPLFINLFVLSNNKLDLFLTSIFCYNFRLLDRTPHSTSCCSFSSSSVSSCSLASWLLALIHLEELVLSKQSQPSRYRMLYPNEHFFSKEIVYALPALRIGITILEYLILITFITSFP